MKDTNLIVMENLGDLAELLSRVSYDASIDPTVGIEETDEAEEQDISREDLQL